MIRFATISDVPTIHAMILALADYEKLREFAVLTTEQLEKHLFGPHPHAEVLIAEEQELPVGFALFFHTFSTFRGQPGIYLEDLFVLPEYRRQGHGKALFVALAQLAKERDCGRLEWSVLNWNQPAINFYESMAAVPQNAWTVYRLTDQPLLTLAESAESTLRAKPSR